MEDLVKSITNQVMLAMKGAVNSKARDNSVVQSGP